MKRLIVTNGYSASGHLHVARAADSYVCLEGLLIWGRSLSDAELAECFGAREKDQATPHWLHLVSRRHLEAIGATGLGFVEFCSRFDAVDLWMDPRPNDQFQLICLLHYLRPHREIVSKLSLVQAPVPLGGFDAGVQAIWKLPAVKISHDRIELAERAWRAFGAATPQDWFGLLATDLSLLPRLRHAVTAFLEELPWRATGLGATEMRVLEFIMGDRVTPSKVFEHEANDSRRVFDYWELGTLLDRIGRCPKPVVSGIKDGPYDLDLVASRDGRYSRYMKSRLAVTPLGYAILGHADDFARHNPIDRWWGGTHLTNDRLWRWDQDNKVLVAP
jgi:hypothetical protein